MEGLIYVLDSLDEAGLNNFISFINSIPYGTHIDIFMDCRYASTDAKNVFVTVMNGNYPHTVHVYNAEGPALQMLNELDGTLIFTPSSLASFKASTCLVPMRDGKVFEPESYPYLKRLEYEKKNTERMMYELGFNEEERKTVTNGGTVYFDCR